MVRYKPSDRRVPTYVAPSSRCFRASHSYAGYVHKKIDMEVALASQHASTALLFSLH